MQAIEIDRPSGSIPVEPRLKARYRDQATHQCLELDARVFQIFSKDTPDLLGSWWEVRTAENRISKFPVSVLTRAAVAKLKADSAQGIEAQRELTVVFDVIHRFVAAGAVSYREAVLAKAEHSPLSHEAFCGCFDSHRFVLAAAVWRFADSNKPIEQVEGGALLKPLARRVGVQLSILDAR
ncbi:MAG: hypothetical protein ABSB35_21785 [Bryobacteraceae bacterium]|jgi:hypothetical protein